MQIYEVKPHFVWKRKFHLFLPNVSSENIKNPKISDVFKEIKRENSEEKG